MEDKLEKLIKMVYKRWKSSFSGNKEVHPDEEEITCFIEGKLSEAENMQVKKHLIICGRCAEIVAIQARTRVFEAENPPDELISRVKNLASHDEKEPVLEIFLKLKERLLEIINTNGDILVGNELVPAPVLRSRQIKDFKDEVRVLKDFKRVRIEVKIENKETKTFNLIIAVKEKHANKIISGLRVTLMRDNLELESYLTDSGSVTFEHVQLGKYTVQVATIENKLATITLDIKT